MNKFLKMFLITITIIVGIFLIFIFEESIRLKNNDASLPLLITDRTKYCVSCIEPGEELEVEYWSLGYKIRIRYYLLEDSSDDNKIIMINEKEFLLFNKLRLWAWAS